MHEFHIHYRNTQGTLMRILTAVSRRGIEMPYVLASGCGLEHRADLLLEVNAKQIGQLVRDWHAIVDVIDVRAGVPVEETLASAAGLSAPHPPASQAAGRASNARLA